MTDRKIDFYAKKYRNAIDAAHKNRQFISDRWFREFPENCCGDTSYLLAEYLRTKGIETIWCSGQRGSETHAWLVVKDRRVNRPSPRIDSFPKEVRNAMNRYGADLFRQEEEATRYSEMDLEKGLIIDITADQFDDYDISVYVGYSNPFHYTFDFKEAQDYDGLKSERLENLYKKIEKFL